MNHSRIKKNFGTGEMYIMLTVTDVYLNIYSVMCFYPFKKLP